MAVVQEERHSSEWHCFRCMNRNYSFCNERAVETKTFFAVVVVLLYLFFSFFFSFIFFFLLLLLYICFSASYFFFYFLMFLKLGLLVFKAIESFSPVHTDPAGLKLRRCLFPSSISRQQGSDLFPTIINLNSFYSLADRLLTICVFF